MAKPFVGTENFDPLTLTLTFDLLLNKLNLSIYFWTERDMACILSIDIPCGKTFLSVPKLLISWPWPPTLTYFWKNLTLALTFKPKEIWLLYLAWIFLVARSFCLYQNFWSITLPSNFDLLLKELNFKSKEILRDCKSLGGGFPFGCPDLVTGTGVHHMYLVFALCRV